MDINNNIKRDSGLYKRKSIQIGKRPFIVMNVFTECGKQITEDRVEGKKNL